MRRFVRPLVCLVLVSFLLGAVLYAETVVFLTTNDSHSHIQPYKVKVYVGGKKIKKYVGGYARVAAVVDQVRGQYPGKVIVVDAGDILTGPVYRAFGGYVEMVAMSLIGYDVITLGNHEFDLGPEMLANAIRHAAFDIVCANIKIDLPEFKGAIKPYIIKNVGGIKVGIFGLTTPELMVISNPGPHVTVEQDFIGVAKKMVATLKGKADIIVALTHLGKINDIRLAKAVPGIDIIIGGHSHDLIEEPIVVTHEDGTKTYIVQAGSYLRYVGKLIAEVKKGKLEDVKWEIIELDEKVGEEPFVKNFIAKYMGKLEEMYAKPVGETLVDLDARKSAVRCGESNIGNLFADSFRWRTKADIAATNGGGIRGNMIYPKGTLTYKTLLKMHPFGNTIVVVKMTGADIIKMFEISASALIGPGDTYKPEERTPTGGFLQVSGVRVTYDITKPPTLIDNTGKLIKWGNRVVKVEVLENGKYVPIDPNKTYTVAINSWMAKGGDKYFIFKDKEKRDTFCSMVDVLAEYIQHLGGKIAPKVEGRIIIIGKK